MSTVGRHFFVNFDAIAEYFYGLIINGLITGVMKRTFRLFGVLVVLNALPDNVNRLSC